MTESFFAFGPPAQGGNTVYYTRCQSRLSGVFDRPFRVDGVVRVLCLPRKSPHPFHTWLGH